MTNPIEKLSDVQISTSKKGTNTKSINAPIQKNAYIDKSLQREYGSKEQSQENRMPYHHPNHKVGYGQRQDQKIYKQYSSFRQRNYKFEKQKRQNQQLGWKPKIRSSIQIVDQQKVPIKINLWWIDSQSMQQFCLGIHKSYHLVLSSVTTTSREDPKKTLRVRTRVKGKPFNNYALRTKHI